MIKQKNLASETGWRLYLKQLVSYMILKHEKIALKFVYMDFLSDKNCHEDENILYYTNKLIKALFQYECNHLQCFDSTILILTKK